MAMIESVKKIWPNTNNIGIYHPDFTEENKYTEADDQLEYLEADQDNDEAREDDEVKENENTVTFNVKKEWINKYRGKIFNTLVILHM